MVDAGRISQVSQGDKGRTSIAVGERSLRETSCLTSEWMSHAGMCSCVQEVANVIKENGMPTSIRILLVLPTIPCITFQVHPNARTTSTATARKLQFIFMPLGVPPRPQG